jgi:tripartite-type tricarboxylate transporter receptor subunit TctC
MKTVRAALLFLVAMFPTVVAYAQDYPSRPIRLIIPWPPGGITDVIARGLGAALSESMGQQVIPDNRPGAAGTLGVGIAAK